MEGIDCHEGKRQDLTPLPRFSVPVPSAAPLVEYARKAIGASSGGWSKLFPP